MPDKPIIWRGSVTDLATDIAAELTAEQVRELRSALGKRTPHEQLVDVPGWTVGEVFTGYIEYIKNSRGSQITVDFDGQTLTTSEMVSGYGGYSATVNVPLELLRALGVAA